MQELARPAGGIHEIQSHEACQLQQIGDNAEGSATHNHSHAASHKSKSTPKTVISDINNNDVKIMNNTINNNNNATSSASPAVTTTPDPLDATSTVVSTRLAHLSLGSLCCYRCCVTLFSLLFSTATMGKGNGTYRSSPPAEVM
ncbi:unnamed protein product [Polarella glacialis]|uniref:Uncharacterized protein n=1 Tax=Polarella glacialis TaxID=89957 RepID=A0A813K4U4_POLGL|nr:unnamed protein product [Polarella glacialis]